jgi:ubiquitin-conjugating enzyme E2 variant
VDPTAMCNHDFIETNADASLFSVVLNTYLLTLHPLNPASQFDLCLYLFAFFGGFFAAFTNEFHKWSHQNKLPWWVSLLQTCWVVLPKRHHAVHHKPPFDKYYCITTGHLNYFLDGIGFWRTAEKVITTVTGVNAREDDKLWTGQIYGE